MSASSPDTAAPTPVSPPAELKPLLERVTDGESLTVGEAESVFHSFMTGQASPVQMAGFLVALRSKGLAPAEVAGGVRALRRAMIPVAAADPDALVDTAGTGGGEVTTFNISTAAALTAAGAGVRLAKHGNRSFTSRSGSADVLEALGVRIELSPEAMGEILGEVGIVFMFAPLLHPAMRHVGPVRRELGFATAMNILGPLTNPAGARRQVVGVADPNLLPLIAMALRELGHHRALVVHGSPGMDEISPAGPTEIAELEGGEVRRHRVTPEELGVEAGSIDAIGGGEPEDNARIITNVLSGIVRDAARTAVVLNAGAAIYAGGAVDTLSDGVRRAEQSIDSGSAMEKLELLRLASQRS